MWACGCTLTRSVDLWKPWIRFTYMYACANPRKPVRHVQSLTVTQVYSMFNRKIQFFKLFWTHANLWEKKDKLWDLGSSLKHLISLNLWFLQSMFLSLFLFFFFFFFLLPVPLPMMWNCWQSYRCNAELYDHSFFILQFRYIEKLT